MNYTEQRTQNLESLIRGYLTSKRLQSPDNYAITMLALYEYVTTGFALYLGLPTGIFNKIVGDMKRAGIIGMAKGGDIVFLSNAAWELYTKKNTTNQKPLTTPVGPSVRINMDHYITKGVFGSTSEIVTKLIECGLVTKNSNASTGIEGDVMRIDAWLKVQEAEFDKKNTSNEVKS